MKLLIIRHADPDYSIDSLTPTGWEEAKLLADYLADWKIDHFYQSPLGRAKDTASLTLRKLGREAETLPWLREFRGNVEKPGVPPNSGCAWDWLPAEWTKEPRFYDKDHWFEPEPMAAVNIPAEAKWVTEGLDALLAKHGYVREDGYYRAERANEETIAIFCHFGLECVLLGHLLHISPMVLWHGFCAAPTSMTLVHTEERRAGIASFRVARFGDVTHLLQAGREPSFSARFCETFANTEQRHD